ncbi:MAG TPA: DUF2141 domain-containing protein [Crinalium sp.]|jgi:uncharacterized protein (DUF2141 family)
MGKTLKATAWFLIALGAINLSGHANAQLTGSLTVEVDGLDSQEGNLCLKVFSGSSGFPNSNESAVERTCVAIAQPPSETSPSEITSDGSLSDGSLSYTFNNLPFNTYAVAVYHDRNGDEQLNRGAFGIPSEGYGFSNNAPANLGPPSYRDAAFLLAGPNTTIQIKIIYPQ